MSEPQAPEEIVVVTTPYLSSMRIVRVLGMTWGTVVRSRGIGHQIAAGFRGLAGGEISEYTEMLNHARGLALERLKEHARAMGANAVIGVGFDSSELGQTMSEVLAFGTAVIVAQEEASSAVHLV